ncbi:MAG: NADH-quinone oxidoreductase subunit NuoG [Methylococcales bacterium]|nr:NADH-quinone oxidoreductase subunit NuoG [Methylococcales bacterium]
MNTIDIDIDGLAYRVKSGVSLLTACQTLGLDLPYFCWHPALGSVGACRQCAVIQYRDAADSLGRLTMACMTPVTDGMRVSIAAEQAQRFRGVNIELLMTNHPHDCPVCEEGGECHLQDMTLLSGHTRRRYRGLKRTHKNQYLGPFLNHEMNRCIACYRCVRFYADYAGGSDLQVLGMHHNVYFGRFEDGALENEFSGNLAEVCPTGVFTDKTFSAHYARKWDLQTAPSVCVHCGLGCNISPGERYGRLRRVVNRYHGDINGYFLCDRGRFGYDFVNSPERIRTPRLDNHAEIAADAAQQRFRAMLNGHLPAIGIGSPRASLETNFALRSLVGAENFYAGLDGGEQAMLETIRDLLADGGVHTPSLREVEQADAVLILGEDPVNTAPRLGLALRQTVRNAAFRRAGELGLPPWRDAAVRELEKQHRSPLFIASICPTRLDDVAGRCYRASPQDIARLGFAVAHCLDGQAPSPAGLDAAQQALAAEIAAALRQAARPLIVSGTGCGELAAIQAAYNVARALRPNGGQLVFSVPESNSLGLTMMAGKPLQQAFRRVAEHTAGCVIIVENDLYRRAPAQAVDAFLQQAAQVVVIDCLPHQTAARAGLLLPAATYAESAGTLVNNEGRAQRYFPVYPPPEPVRGAWQWLLAAMDNSDCRHFDDLTAACAQAFPALAGIVAAAPDAAFRVDAMKIPRQPPRYSGRTAMLADLKVSEPRQAQDAETALAFSMEGASVGIPAALQPVFWTPGWNSAQAVNRFQAEIGGHLSGGDGGIRLFEAAGEGAWFTQIPDAFRPEPGLWRVLPPPLHIFGGEELSLHAPALAERAPPPGVLLNPADAETLAVASGEWLVIASADGALSRCLPVKIEPTLACGLLVAAGLPDCIALAWAGPVTLQKGDRP